MSTLTLMISKMLGFLLVLLPLVSCTYQKEEEPTNYEYHDINFSSHEIDPLLAVTNEEALQYGADVAYISSSGDTLISFGEFAYFGTDSLKHFANVIIHPNDSTFGRQVGIDRNGSILFDIVLFDNGPDYINEGLMRVKRNGKMGFANEKGEIVIPCEYDFAKWFVDGYAEVTYQATFYTDLDGHQRVESNNWFTIDRNGNQVDASKSGN